MGPIFPGQADDRVFRTVKRMGGITQNEEGSLLGWLLEGGWMPDDIPPVGMARRSSLLTRVDIGFVPFAEVIIPVPFLERLHTSYRPSNGRESVVVTRGPIRRLVLN